MHKLEGPILVLDVETTGTDPQHDQIIELSFQLGLADGAPSETWRFKPSVSTCVSMSFSSAAIDSGSSAGACSSIPAPESGTWR